MATVKKATVVESTPDPAQVKSQGLQLLSPLQPAVSKLTIKTATDYLDADELLGRIRNARKKWAQMLEPIEAPLKRAQAEIKLSLQGAKALDTAVDGPLEQMETRVKESMRAFKLEEQRQLQAAKEEAEREEAERQRLIREAAAKEAAAKTAPMKARLAAIRENLETQSAQSQLVDLNPAVKGASSASRSVRKVRITSLAELVAALVPYTPLAGMYRLGTPPLSLISEEMLQTALNKLHKEQPGAVESWPGVEGYDDIIIAGR